MKQFITLTAAATIMLIMVGCSTTGNADVASASVDQAVACEKCETTWVRRAGHPSKQPLMITRNKKMMTCPDCSSAATNFFKTGELKHACSSCGGTLESCDVH